MSEFTVRLMSFEPVATTATVVQAHDLFCNIRIDWAIAAVGNGRVSEWMSEWVNGRLGRQHKMMEFQRSYELSLLNSLAILFAASWKTTINTYSNFEPLDFLGYHNKSIRMLICAHFGHLCNANQSEWIDDVLVSIYILLTIPICTVRIGHMQKVDSLSGFEQLMELMQIALQMCRLK